MAPGPRRECLPRLQAHPRSLRAAEHPERPTDPPRRPRRRHDGPHLRPETPEPHVSDDNPFSESAFKTLKYHAGYPGRFGGFDDALAYCREFFPWYNTGHRHSGIGYLTPETVHYGLAPPAIEGRQKALLAAYHAHPERFVRKPPSPSPLPEAVWINPPKQLMRKEAAALACYTNF
jgi:putative transposase